MEKIEQELAPSRGGGQGARGAKAARKYVSEMTEQQKERAWQALRH